MIETMALRTRFLWILSAWTIAGIGCGGTVQGTSSGTSSETGGTGGTGVVDTTGAGTGGSTSTCPTSDGFAECAGVCVSLQNDPANCGSCDQECPTGQTCVKAVCECPAGTTACDAQCFNLATDPANCGGCGSPCAPTDVCVDGTCQGTQCFPAAVEYCYTGPAGTLSVGACKPGTKSCKPDGTGFGPCESQVTPLPEDCSSPSDDDCDGAVNQGCTYASCKALLAATPGSPDGLFTIDPDGPGGQDAFEVFCDMTSSDGGWTLVARTFKGINYQVYSWIDILSTNFLGNTSITLSNQVPAGYYDDYAFFALLSATSQMQFQDVRIRDGVGDYVQSMIAPKTMAQIHDEEGVEPLYQGGVNTGVLLLLGNSLHTSPLLPCFYPNIDGQSCQSYFDGDTGSQTTAFYVGDLEACANGPAAGNLAGALWGSENCYQNDKAGGFGGFSYFRPINASQGHVSSGYDGAPWAVFYR